MARRPQPPEPPPRTAQTRLGLIVALSLAVGLLVAVVLVAAPFVPAEEHALTGVVLLGFALGVGVVGCAVRPVQRPAPTVGSCAGRVHGAGQPCCS